MDKTSPYREWAKKNQAFLNDLLAKKYISKEDLRKISNFKNQYSLQEQESAFKNFKERAQKTFSDERANPLLEDKEFGQKDFIKSAVEFRKTLDAFDKKDPLLSSRLIEEINNSSAYVVSVDINSGMNGDTGDAEQAVFSDLTVTIGYVKTGLIAENAGRYIKRLVCTDIGIVLTREEYKIYGTDEPAVMGTLPCPEWLDMHIQKAY